MARPRFVVVATDDGVKVKLGHFGDAKQYIFYEVTEQGIREVKRLENPFKGEEEEHMHGVLRKRLKLLELFGSIDAVVSTFFGPGGEDFFKERGIDAIKVKPWTTIEDALKQVQEMYFGKA